MSYGKKDTRQTFEDLFQVQLNIRKKFSKKNF